MLDWRNRQNGDGGWAYKQGTSWTEPTVFALLAQTATQIDRKQYDAGLKFLDSTQRPDGGWSPQPSVAESTWVTALAALLPEEAIGPGRMEKALKWLEGQTGQESSWSFQFQRWISGQDRSPNGWPWFPGAAAWVIPTSFGVLAFNHSLSRNESRARRKRVESGHDFLLLHMCADGGWNHGGNRALGRDGDSYPETTGIALTALQGVADRNAIARGKKAARRHLATCRTAEGQAWLCIGLAAHGEFVKPFGEPIPRTVVDSALITLANCDPAKNPLLKSAL